jgi:hypothetical protein
MSGSAPGVGPLPGKNPGSAPASDVTFGPLCRPTYFIKSFYSGPYTCIRKYLVYFKRSLATLCKQHRSTQRHVYKVDTGTTHDVLQRGTLMHRSHLSSLPRRLSRVLCPHTRSQFCPCARNETT